MTPEQQTELENLEVSTPPLAGDLSREKVAERPGFKPVSATAADPKNIEAFKQKYGKS